VCFEVRIQYKNPLNTHLAVNANNFPGVAAPLFGGILAGKQPFMSHDGSLYVATLLDGVHLDGIMGNDDSEVLYHFIQFVRPCDA
jgi:hypothetical protein